MAGSLNPPPPPESKAVGYCCFIVVMPAEGMVSAGFSPLHSWLSIIGVVPPTAAHVSRQEGDERTWQALRSDRKNKSGSLGFEIGQACSGPPLSTGRVPAGESLIDLHGDQMDHLPLLTSLRFRVYWERQQNAIICFFSLFNFSFIFWFSFLNIVCILCIIAFGASSFYSFLYQKCTTLYHIFNYWNGVYFRRVELCLRVLKRHTLTAHCFSNEFLQDVEIALGLWRTVRQHPSCLYSLWSDSWFRRSSLFSSVTNMLLCSFWICCMGCRLYSVVSSLHVHNLLLMNFLDVENKHRFKSWMFSLVSRSSNKTTVWFSWTHSHWWFRSSWIELSQLR